MKRRFIALFAVLLFCGSFASARSAGDSGGGSKSLGSLMKAYFTWFLGGDQADHVKNVVFIPLPNGSPSEDDPRISVGTADVTLHPGDTFALPVFTFIGETYLEGNVPDDPPGFPPKSVFTSAHILVKLDGKPLIDSRRDNLSNFYFDTQYFDEPIPYNPPKEYAPDVHAIGAIWTKGIGLVQQPLPKGTHTLTLSVFTDDFNFGFENTWHITVEKN